MVALRRAPGRAATSSTGEHMRYMLAFLALGLAGCTSAAGSLVPLRAVGKASGDAEGPQVFLAGVPMNALVRIHGTVKYTVQPIPPYVTLDGDYTIIVEPLPGQEPAAQQAIERGDLLIRRAGKAGALNAPGSIQAWKAMRTRVYAPPPAPPVEPLKTAVAPACCGPECEVPTLSASK